jgi:hypothetical protein
MPDLCAKKRRENAEYELLHRVLGIASTPRGWGDSGHRVRSYGPEVTC